MNALKIVKDYYAAFNDKEWDKMLALVGDDIRHEPNQGEPREGKELFSEFLKKMDDSYEETLTNMKFYVSEGNDGSIAAEFTVNGIYKQAEAGLPPAEGQAYVLPAAAFLKVKDGKIVRVATHYNLELWIELVS